MTELWSSQFLVDDRYFYLLRLYNNLMTAHFNSLIQQRRGLLFSQLIFDGWYLKEVWRRRQICIHNSSLTTLKWYLLVSWKLPIRREDTCSFELFFRHRRHHKLIHVHILGDTFINCLGNCHSLLYKPQVILLRFRLELFGALPLHLRPL